MRDLENVCDSEGVNEGESKREKKERDACVRVREK